MGQPPVRQDERNISWRRFDHDPSVQQIRNLGYGRPDPGRQEDV
jgi:hypothetical protein